MASAYKMTQNKQGLNMGIRSILRRKETSDYSGKSSGVILLSICLIMSFFWATWFHWYQRPEDYRLQLEWGERLMKKGNVLLSDFFDKDSQVCFIPFYSTGKEITLSEKDREYLNMAIKGVVGSSDVNWWVVVILAGEIKKAYRMGLDLTPEENKVQCLKAENARLEKKERFIRNGKYRVIFTLTMVKE